MMRPVAVIGIGMTRFGKQPDRSLKELSSEAVAQALGDAGIAPDDLDAVYFANSLAGPITGQEMIRGQVVLRPAGIRGIPIVNVENACASGATALHLAWLAVASGHHDVVLAVGAEKMTHPDKERTLAALATAVDVEAAAAPGSGSQSSNMDNYAGLTRSYMERSGATPEDFARLACKAQRNGARNPAAQYGADRTIEEVLASRMISAPLTLLMCSPISDGAAAAVVASWGAARALVGRAVRVAASVLVSGEPGRGDRMEADRRAAAAAYETAGIRPADISLAEVHDAAAPAELMAYESLGLVGEGEGPLLLRSGETEIGGRIPVNPSGGLLARGHPLAATGLAQIYELVAQLRGEAGPRQVVGARIGIAENAGGWFEGDAAAAAVHILRAD